MADIVNSIKLNYLRIQHCTTHRKYTTTESTTFFLLISDSILSWIGNWQSTNIKSIISLTKEDSAITADADIALCKPTTHLPIKLT